MDEEQKERDARAGKIAWAILTKKQPTKITAVLAAAIGLLIFADVCKKNGICIRKRILALSAPLRWLVYLSLFLVLLIFGEYGENAAQFIYFVF